MTRLFSYFAIILLAGCTRHVEYRTIHSPWDGRILRVGHESCGAPCDQRDILTLQDIASDGKREDIELAVIDDAAKIDIGWPSAGRIIIGACEAGSAKVQSGLPRVAAFNRLVTIDVVLTTVELPINGRTYCRGYGKYSLE